MQGGNIWYIFKLWSPEYHSPYVDLSSKLIICINTT